MVLLFLGMITMKQKMGFSVEKDSKWLVFVFTTPLSVASIVWTKLLVIAWRMFTPTLVVLPLFLVGTAYGGLSLGEVGWLYLFLLLLFLYVAAGVIYQSIYRKAESKKTPALVWLLYLPLYSLLFGPVFDMVVNVLPEPIPSLWHEWRSSDFAPAAFLYLLGCHPLGSVYLAIKQGWNLPLWPATVPPSVWIVGAAGQILFFGIFVLLIIREFRPQTIAQMLGEP
ncbi:hypothetical protein K2X85_18115, partial [bacterium]|nr:hypothetical protein [bacterium]